MSKPKRMTFYATPDDRDVIQRIQALRPHYTFNFAVREALLMLLRSLDQPSHITPTRHPRQVQ